MVQNSQVKFLEAQIRECYGRVTWSHKTQEKCADILLRRHNYIKIIQIIISVVTTTGILFSVFGENKVIGIISAILSAILVGINAYVKGHDLGEIGQKHSDAAVNLWLIREKYLSLITDINSNLLTIESITDKRDHLQDELANIYKGSPRTISKAYLKATKALKLNEEMTFSDEEIDFLLPKTLRKT